MRSKQSLGLDEIMIINPSSKGGAFMLHRPLHGNYVGQVPDAFPEDIGYYGQPSADEAADYGQYPGAGIGYYGQYSGDEPGYGQYPENEMGYYGQYPEDDMGYGQYPEEDVGYYGQYPEDESGYGQYPEDEMGYYGQYPEDDMGYGQYPDEDMGYYGQYPGDGMEGYVPEVEPPFNPRGDFGTQLSGYEREKTVNPTCAFQRPAEVTPVTGIPDIFKPYL